MAEVKPRGELLDRGQCARTFGVHRSTVDEWILAGMPVFRQSPRRGIPTAIDSVAAHEWLVARKLTDAPDAPDGADVQGERARLLRAQAELAELELARRRG